MGISAPDETLRDVDSVREVIGQIGAFEASKRAAAIPFFKAVLAGRYDEAGQAAAQQVVEACGWERAGPTAVSDP